MRVGAGGGGWVGTKFQIRVSPHAKKTKTLTDGSMPKTITKRFIFPGLRHGLSSSSAVTWNAWCPHPNISLHIAKKYPNDILFQSLFIFCGSEDVRLLGPASKHPRRCGPRSKPDGFAPMWFDRRIAWLFKSSMSFCHKSRPLWCDSVIP